MAIDSYSKRASILGCITRFLPIPTGSFDQGDRQTFLRLYNDNLAGTPVAPSGGLASIRGNFMASITENIE